MNKLDLATVGLLSSLAMAFSPLASAEWVGPFPVRYIESYNNSLFFMLDANGATTYGNIRPGCNNTSMFFHGAVLSEKTIDRALAIGTAAQATGTKVKFFVTGCNDYVTVSAIASDPTW